jgi:hypothetical protein
MSIGAMKVPKGRVYSQFQFDLRQGDRIVRRIDDYPELSKALREGDLPTARLLCARLFDLECGSAETKVHRAQAGKG